MVRVKILKPCDSKGYKGGKNEMIYMSRIIVNPKILGGKPIIKGTRISVEFILELLSSGMTTKDILKEYPHLKKEDIFTALDFATKSVKREEILPPIRINQKR